MTDVTRTTIFDRNKDQIPDRIDLIVGGSGGAGRAPVTARPFANMGEGKARPPEDLLEWTDDMHEARDLLSSMTRPQIYAVLASVAFGD